jgi:hypothetical protein
VIGVLDQFMRVAPEFVGLVMDTIVGLTTDRYVMIAFALIRVLLAPLGEVLAHLWGRAVECPEQ